MRIAIETFWLNTKELTGVGYYILNVLKEIDNQNPGNTYYLLYTGARWIGPDLGKNFIPVCYGKGRATFAIWFNLHKVIKKLKPDIYHASFPSRVPPQKLTCHVVTTVCDLLALHIEGFWRRFVFKLTTHWAWKNSNHFLCISEYTANEIIAYKNIPRDKLTVTYLAPAHEVKKWNPPGKHLLFVGSLTHRKNPLFLAEVYKKLCAIMDIVPSLIFVGEDRDQGDNIKSHIRSCPSNGRIEWLSYISSDDLSKLYQDSILFILPSKLEGFGMPVIEAMAAGVPVVCSEISIFHEISGGAVEIISGWEARNWAVKLKTILEDSTYLNSLSVKGLKRANDFNWEKCAELTMSAYKKLLCKDE